MFSGPKVAGNPALRQWVHIISVLFVFSYIAFDVLDLDLSDFVWNHGPREEAPIISDAVKLPELSDPAKLSNVRIPRSVIQSLYTQTSIQIRALTIPSVPRTPTIFHRLILPASTSDPSPGD